MAGDDSVWKDKELSRIFLDNVRGAIPFAAEQIEILHAVVSHALPRVSNFLDIGCGDGVLGKTVLLKYPASKGVFLDFSSPMIEKAAANLSDFKDRTELLLRDFGEKGWVEAVAEKAPFDLVVSGLAIHHQSDESKFRIYGDIFGLLSPGGVFLNIEHVLSPTELVKTMADDYFIDSLYEYNRARGLTREEVAGEFYNRVDKAANILGPVETQCEWLKRIGFTDVDCFFKVFELAVFGGRRPASSGTD